MFSVTLRDFCPINRWTADEKGPYWEGNYKPEVMGPYQYLIDQTTDRRYLNQDPGVVRTKCILLTFGTPFIHLIASIANVAYRIWNLISLAHFKEQSTSEWEEKTPYSFKASLKETFKDCVKVFTTPLAYFGLELAAIFGIISPYDGRKLYATIERAQYGNSILAPWFQPCDPYHLRRHQ